MIIPVKNQLHLTQQLINELIAQGEAAEIVVVDNGCTDGTLDWLVTQPTVMVLSMCGEGIHTMWNAAAAYLVDKYGTQQNIAILNNDIEIGKCFLSRLAAGLRTDSELVAVSPNYDGRQTDEAVVEVHDICKGRYDGTGGLAGFAMMLTGEWLAEYQFPEQLMWWFGDDDLVLSIKAKSKKAGIVNGVTCLHINGGSLTTKAEDGHELRQRVRRDRRVFQAKWP